MTEWNFTTRDEIEEVRNALKIYFPNKSSDRAAFNTICDMAVKYLKAPQPEAAPTLPTAYGLQVIAHLNSKFSSGNIVPVDSSIINRSEYRMIVEALCGQPSPSQNDPQSLPQSKTEWKGPYVARNASGELPSAFTAASNSEGGKK